MKQEREKAKEPELYSGGRVKWKSHGGEATGTVVKKLTAETEIKGHRAAASTNNPEFLVRSANRAGRPHTSLLRSRKPSRKGGTMLDRIWPAS
jgi:hypothetical protein